jgi:hypothetical protein
MRFRRWQEIFGAKPGESRAHAEMRSNRNHRKAMRKQRRREATV